MLKVLLVDDEPYMLEGLRVMIDWKSYGFNICGEASNGEDALEIIKMSDPDLIITDIRMPRMDGLELIRTACEKLRSTAKFVILSGYDDFNYAKQAMMYKIKNYLLKPLDDDELRDVVSKLSAEIMLERRKAENINKQLTFIANQCLQRLINGENKPTLIERTKMLLNLKERYEYRCVMLYIDSLNGLARKTGKMDTEIKRNKVIELLQAELGIEYQYNIFEDKEERICLIICEDMPFYHQLEAFLTRLQLKLRNMTGACVSLAYSAPAKEIAVLSEMYRQALFALDFKFYMGDNSIIGYTEVQNEKLCYQVYNPDFSDLLHHIRINGSESLKEEVQSIFNCFCDAKSAPEIIVAYLNNFLLELVRVIHEFDGVSKDTLQMVLEFDNFSGYPSLDSLSEAFLERCIYAANYIDNLKKSDSQYVIYEIKNYINGHYHQDIKLKKVAAMFYMNPVYLGQLFKKATGMQFNDYLNYVRIEEAKKLLRQTNMKVVEISKVVGYKDPKYFVQKFKATTNTSPSSFKSCN
ncbi:two-component system response regulator YesN [Ruminiclostridium sufflavum DSM 19573]|uniref:Stage 0 sporulation protein A homolog n=1 Tax=Ruminiclostridium sufflavum DSM 19573 TaxID=1121337 RepID=A0A318Y1F8_9FIRM|nr:response regulator [Ruminiclostridium sufflavum]PYG89179.1 two-component system response regulator YesN [Ruminiclostridium sufflavum DSM 19573]